MIVPHGGTRLAMGDRLTILGDLERMISVQMWLE
jgi:Trk K+ transport system NAD-binding subunit